MAALDERCDAEGVEDSVGIECLDLLFFSADAYEGCFVEAIWTVAYSHSWFLGFYFFIFIRLSKLIEIENVLHQSN